MKSKITENNVQSKSKKICLCMIVKNESKIIERCLNSAKPVIDFVSICDTGSTDETPKLIENWCKENNIPGTIHHKAFKNFGYNRTLSVCLAQETYPESDYLLLLDADMVLEVLPDFDKSNLYYSQYLVMQYSKYIKYWNPRLIRTSLPWKCEGVTHEYWKLEQSKILPNQSKLVTEVGKLESLIIEDQEDGGSKSDKFDRDKKLLLEGINDPSTPEYLKTRYMFYLAQTFFDLNEFEDSIYWYTRRIKEGGWGEELFYSALQIGLCYDYLANMTTWEIEQKIKVKEDDNEIKNLKEREEQLIALSIFNLQKAWEIRPCRAEPLYHLARIYRLKANHHLALMYALQGKETPFPKEDVLFVDYRVYEYLIDYEISINAYYVENKRHLGRRSQKLLELKIDDLPLEIANSVKNNTKFY